MNNRHVNKLNSFLGLIFLFSFLLNCLFLTVILLKAIKENMNNLEISEKMLIAHKNPMGTECDPRYLLKLGSDEIFEYDKNNSVAAEMNNAWNNPFDKSFNFKELLKKGSEEIKKYETKK